VVLPNQDNNAIKTSWPSIGCWFWTAEEFKPDGYKRFLDLHAVHSPFSLLTTSLRFPGELNEKTVHDQLKLGTDYARSKGIGIVMDLDVRLAREDFRKRYPEELQQIVLLREMPLKAAGMMNYGIKSPSFSDHYTYGRTGYDAIKTELIGCFKYRKTEGLIDPGTITDVLNRAITQTWQDSIHISFQAEPSDEGMVACMLVAVTVFTPDVFAPHLISYQREMLNQYRDIAFAGACKDEWGFPGRFGPRKDELWYSPAMGDHYTKRQPGRNLLRDLMLMSFGEKGHERERIAAVNHYMEMNWQRNAEIETDYYEAIKETFGINAVSATHPTWYPFPDEKEIFKNGLSWWSSKRDLAQTDESTPFAIRTALAKKMNSPLWYNMFYEEKMADYKYALWSAVLGGGRLNYHPLWPSDFDKLTTSLLQDSLLMAERRISLLNYISTAPVQSPIAVIFGHASAINFNNSVGFADVGLELSNAFWKEGYYTDLIPTSEIENGSLKINSEGMIQYGPQVYETIILYHPEYSRSEIAAFFNQASANKANKLFRVGNQSVGFNGEMINNKKLFPESMIEFKYSEPAVAALIQDLKARGVKPQAAGAMKSSSGFSPSVMPGVSGTIRLIDGTVIMASGRGSVMGDIIDTTININNTNVQFHATGIAAIRLDSAGNVEAFAAGGLKRLNAGNLQIELSEGADLALFKEGSIYRGIIHGWEGKLPEALTKLTKNWTRVNVPSAMKQN
jgi:hypothetical protein